MEKDELSCMNKNWLKPRVLFSNRFKVDSQLQFFFVDA